MATTRPAALLSGDSSMPPPAWSDARTCCQRSHFLRRDGHTASALTPPNLPHTTAVFRPTVEEFADPMTYICSIRKVAEISGIAKIVPYVKPALAPALLDHS